MAYDLLIKKLKEFNFCENYSIHLSGKKYNIK